MSPLTMNANDRPVAEAAIARLERMPGVTRVAPGAFSETRHQQAVGELKVVAREPHSVQVRIYTRRGMQNVHVYTNNMDTFISAMAARLVRANTEPTPTKGAMAIAMRGALEEGRGHSSPKVSEGPARPKGQPFVVGRITKEKNKQPHYPADPAPILPAAPVFGSDVVGKLVEVTPDIACNWLERNTQNRKLRDLDVHRYAADMKAGRWKAGGNAIKFDTNGNIVNGQHALWAVIEAGVTVPMFVISGVDPSVVLVEDDHARRSLSDVIKIQHKGWSVTTTHTATSTCLRLSMQWATGRTVSKDIASRQEQVAFLEQHEEALAFAGSVFSGKGGRRGIVVAAVLAVVARAYYTQDRDRLRRFAHVLQSGMVEDVRENAVILLRNQLMQTMGGTINAAHRQEVYYKTERVLVAFLAGETLRVLKPQAAEEHFPLPEEPFNKRRKKG